MGKKRVATKGSKAGDGPKKGAGAFRLSRKKLGAGVLQVQATFNNTKAILTDTDGNAVAWSSSGSLGFKGARKSTPFAAAKVGEMLGEKAKALGLSDVQVVVKGVGSGRESCIRAFIGMCNASISSIKDTTPMPFNGPRARKPRRV